MRISAIKFGWLKRFMPRGLYGRAALILILPVFIIQIVVSVTFIQRHFEGVTEQMTVSVARDVAFLIAAVDDAQTPQEARFRADSIGEALGLSAQLPAVEVPTTDSRGLLDLSGRVLIAALHTEVPGLEGIELPRDEKIVRIGARTHHGPMLIALPRSRVSASNPHQLLVLMVVTSVLMTLISYLFLRNQLRPIKRMARAAEAFGKGQSLPFRPTGATEVRAAGQAFLEMRERIERYVEQRTLMLSGVSHDLRTPLTRLRLGLSLLDEDDPEVGEMKRDLDEMEEMLDAFLAFARGDALEEPERADPVAIARRAVEKAHRTGQNVSLGHVDTVQDGGGPVVLRPQAVARALDNLVGNAVRYGRQAQVSVALSDHELRFTVEDDGPGIPESQRDAAQRAFTRLDAARNQDRGGGVGLGLTIAADIARSHGGRLMLDASPTLGGLRAELVLAR